MGWKLKITIFLIKILFLPFLIINTVARLFGFGPKQRFGVTLYRRQGDVTEFVHAVEFGDKVLEQHGTVGEFAERTYLPLEELGAVKARVSELIAEGFVEAGAFGGFAYVDLTAPTKEEWPSKAEYGLRNEFWEELDSFLADRGLGYIDGASGGSGTMELGLNLVDLDLAKSAILDFVEGTKFAEFTRFIVLDHEDFEAA